MGSFYYQGDHVILQVTRRAAMTRYEDRWPLVKLWLAYEDSHLFRNRRPECSALSKRT